MNPYDSEGTTIISGIKEPTKKLPKRYELVLWLLPVLVPALVTRVLGLSIFDSDLTYMNFTLPIMFACFFGLYLVAITLTLGLRVKRFVAYLLVCVGFLAFYEYAMYQIIESC